MLLSLVVVVVLLLLGLAHTTPYAKGYARTGQGHRHFERLAVGAKFGTANLPIRASTNFGSGESSQEIFIEDPTVGNSSGTSSSSFLFTLKPRVE